MATEYYQFRRLPRIWFDFDPVLVSRKRCPNVDIKKEYELIQQKKSTLSASERRAVIREINRAK
jgi:hypothetical protein